MAQPKVEITRTDLETTKQLFDRGAAAFVDVRGADAYRRSHVPGALHIPLREVLLRRAEIPRDKPTIFY